MKARPTRFASKQLAVLRSVRKRMPRPAQVIESARDKEQRKRVKQVPTEPYMTPAWVNTL